MCYKNTNICRTFSIFGSPDPLSLFFLSQDTNIRAPVSYGGGRRIKRSSKINLVIETGFLSRRYLIYGHPLGVVSFFVESFLLTSRLLANNNPSVDKGWISKHCIKNRYTKIYNQSQYGTANSLQNLYGQFITLWCMLFLCNLWRKSVTFCDSVQLCLSSRLSCQVLFCIAFI